MAVKRDTVTFTSLNKEIKSGSFKNIYVLQGEEPYFIDRLQELIIDTALTEDQRDFNLSLYTAIRPMCARSSVPASNIPLSRNTR